MCTHTHMCTHMHMHTRMHTRAHTHTHTQCMHPCMYAHIHTNGERIDWAFCGYATFYTELTVIAQSVICRK